MTSEDAIEFLENDSFDAAVCDIDLEEENIDGLDILEHVRGTDSEIP